MKNKHKRKTFSTVAIALFSLPGIVSAMDFHYNPALDAPTSTHIEPEVAPKQPESMLKKQSTKALTNEKQNSSPEEGWNFKAPVISSDKTPYITDEREAVRISEEQRWINDGKKYNDNPLNSDNYRITVEAEYSF